MMINLTPEEHALISAIRHAGKFYVHGNKVDKREAVGIMHNAYLRLADKVRNTSEVAH
jgi:hypothetical protein